MDRQWNKPAQGVGDGKMLKTVCNFDAETHAEIKALAVREKTSFAAQVRILVEWGLMEVAAQEND